ncbi:MULTISPECIES: hypothetical protein [Mycolicibacterium]|uniref:Uncharacterized protein n=2 Tax=Mycolicibacterium TaxID=1866885 RepID=A1T9F3_MYCVP|nr:MULTISPECIES: hypothetical protein [Mycolicibacterium]ABM13803.1 conserved hypothetical protein [Mycolicibacterium vanbaalenii PYR-1]MCV7130474.1 hypothetical protein [Mycolicibacterium vanbaalenii PYR-1]MDN4518858.1 hypothetical protein [Mycolicibacterium austroafricanum]MDW5609828.1 hypothetical protein [Mycolicibacterium sp. D5.8-2]PQP50665.1 hypothetical protein C6A88_09615 [Mycolicibacterium austroafricanum]
MVDTDERQAVSALAEQTGWHHRVDERSDYFDKGVVRIHVVWQGDAAISGGTLYHDDLMQTYSNDLSTVRGWLKR